MKTMFFCLLLSVPAFAADRFGQLTKEDQPYFKNSQNDGKNSLERIDALVVEVNKLHAKVNKLEAEIAALKEAKSGK